MMSIGGQDIQDNLDSITVRIAQSKDAEQISVMCHELGYPTSPQEVAQRFQRIQTNNQHIVYVALQESQEVIGWVHGHICDLVMMSPLVVIHGLIVDQNRRGCGIGRLLMQKVEQWASEKECYTILVRSNVIRTEAHLFYQKIGYENIKQSKVFSKCLN